MEIVEIYTKSIDDFTIKGHGFSDEEIIETIESHIESEFDPCTYTKVKSKEETWAHWCYCFNNDADENMRMLYFKDRYKGVRGGFKVTLVKME